MNAKPLLSLVARLLERHKIEAILIGNAAAALHGSPVTTIDLDFLIRKSPANRNKLKKLTADIEGAAMMVPFYPVSGLVRILRDCDTLQLDFVTSIHGMRSFEGMRSRSSTIEIEGSTLRVASLADIIKSAKGPVRSTNGTETKFAPVSVLRGSSKASGLRPAHRIWRCWMSSKRRTGNKKSSNKKPTRTEILEALKKETELAQIAQIRALLALPMEERMNFLRKRVGIRATCL